jgi:hypothetical protein
MLIGYASSVPAYSLIISRAGDAVCHWSDIFGYNCDTFRHSSISPIVFIGDLFGTAAALPSSMKTLYINSESVKTGTEAELIEFYYANYNPHAGNSVEIN